MVYPYFIKIVQTFTTETTRTTVKRFSSVELMTNHENAKLSPRLTAQSKEDKS